MNLQGKPVRVLKEGHFLPCEIIRADRLGLNAQPLEFLHGFLNRFHPKGQMTKPGSFRLGILGTWRAVRLDEKLQLSALQFQVNFPITTLRAMILPNNTKAQKVYIKMS